MPANAFSALWRFESVTQRPQQSRRAGGDDGKEESSQKKKDEARAQEGRTNCPEGAGAATLGRRTRCSLDGLSNGTAPRTRTA